LLVDRSITAYISVLGSLIAGCTYVPINAGLPIERMVDVVTLSESDVIVVDQRCLAVAEHVLAGCRRPITVLLPDCNEPPPWTLGLSRHRFILREDIEKSAGLEICNRRSENGGAYLLFTSGSTGTPKGVLIEHSNALAYIGNVSERYRPTPDDRFSHFFDLSFDLSVHDMFLCWGAGACLYCVPHTVRYSPSNFIRNHELTFWFSVPSTAALMSRMHVLRPGVFPSLIWSLFCGEALPMSIARQWQRAAPNSIVENLYGPTEATVAFTAYRLPSRGPTDEDEYDIVPIGFPFPGQQVAVIDYEGRTLPDGEVGELCLGGSQVANGYWQSPQATTERFLPPVGIGQSVRWYRTGDLACNTSRDGLLFHGRIDRQVKIRGYRVELQEIETTLRAASGAEMVAAIPWPLLPGGIAAGVVAFMNRSRLATKAVLEECQKKLPHYMVPSALYELPEWPLDGNGKTDYRVLSSKAESMSCRN
jgi:amino acid adenylation domain-containing protein